MRQRACLLLGLLLRAAARLPCLPAQAAWLPAAAAGRLLACLRLAWGWGALQGLPQRPLLVLRGLPQRRAVAWRPWAVPGAY